MLRLGSVIEYGFGPNTGAISLIYSSLLEKYNVSIGSHVFVNHIGNDLQEQVIKQKKQVGINIRYALPDNFNSIDAEKKNFYFTEIIHEALLKYAKVNPNIDISKLEAIRQEIFSRKFHLEILYKSYLCKKDEKRIAKIIIIPEITRFNFFVLVEDYGVEKCRLLIYTGKPTDFYFADLFFHGKWKSIGEFIISGKRSEIEIHLYSEEWRLVFVNTSGNAARAPLFELFKADVYKDTALQDYIASLNPSIAAVLTHSPN